MADARDEQPRDPKTMAEGHGKNKRLGLESGTSQSLTPNEVSVITSIRATDVVLGLRRSPAGFYAIIRHSGLEWRTENHPSSISDNSIEWSGSIPIPSNPSALVCLEVFASFEFQPMLSTGERLRKLTITVQQLSDRSEKHVPFTFFPKDGDVVSPCSSIVVTIERCNGQSGGDSLAPQVLSPGCSKGNTSDELEDATNIGHHILSCFRKHGEERDLERSVIEFERALGSCPLNHLCRAAALSNLATAKFILYQVHGTDTSFQIPLSLYHNALAARPVGHPDRPSTLVQLAAVYLARFEKQRNEVDGARVEVLLHEVIRLRSTDHGSRDVAFMLQLYASLRAEHNSGSSEPSADLCSGSHLTDEDPWIVSVHLLERFERYGDLADLERAITLTQMLVRSISVWDKRYCRGLENLGVGLLWRFDHLGELRDLEEAISTQRDAVRLTPGGHPDKPGQLSNLGASFITRFDRLGELRDLEEAISTQKDAVQLTPDGHPDKPSRLNNLGVSFKARFDRLGELRDLEEAISRQRDSVRLISDGHPHRPTCLNNLGISLRTCFDCLGELRDLEEAISTQKDAVHLTPDGHPDKPGRLNDLGNTFRVRFDRVGMLRDLEEAISTQRDAVRFTPDGHRDKIACLNDLGSSFRVRFERLGELRDLEEAISTQRDAVHLIPDGHPQKPACLNSLGNSFITRFDRFGELRDLEEAISTQKDAVHLTPDGHPHKPACLNDLANSFRVRFERLAELRDLEEAISTQRDAVHLTPDGHPDRPGWLSNLGNCFRARFDCLGELRDLEEAISTQRDAVRLTPDGHPHKPGQLNNFGISLRTRFERLGEFKDLEEAISAQKDAVRLTPDDHPHKPVCLNNLGISFRTRFDRLGELKDLEEAILTQKDALHLTPDSHPHKPGYLSSLGNSFRARFNHLGELRDLEEAVSAQKDAVRLTPDDHPHKPSWLNSLGKSFRARFDRLGELRDLEEAISTHRDAVQLTPDGHPDKSGRLNDLGNCFITRFNCLEKPRDLEEAILTQRNAVYLTPDGHPDKPVCLNNLGNSFRVRFDRLGELRDLEEAISAQRDAVRLTPDDHPYKPACLNNFGNSFKVRFEHLGELRDLEEAISTQRYALHLTPDGHPHKSGLLNNLGNSLEARFDRLGEHSDLLHAISLYSHSAALPVGPIRVRFRASQNWISCARRVHHRSLLCAYSIAIHLLPQRAWIGLSLTHRYAEVKQGADIVRKAAAAALDSGFPELAVEWLERGRSIVWGEILHLRGSYEQLLSAHPEHARKLQELSTALDNAGATREQFFSTVVDQARMLSAALGHADATDVGSFSLFRTAQSVLSHAQESLEHAADRQRALAIKRDDMLQEIRHLPGFDRFLLPKNFSQLRESAHSGPVVMLNAAESRCDALIVLPNVDHVIHVPLPNFDYQRSTHFQGKLKSFLRQALDHREGKTEKWDRGSWESFLAPLWKCVVKPVMDALAFSITGDLSRIFWCPTGPFVFLPLHAAGFYGIEHSVPGHKIFDFVVSSYVPTLSILAPSRNNHVAPSGALRLLAIRQPSSDGQSHLPGVHTELSHIKDVIDNSPLACTVLLESSTGTVEEVLGLMKESDWVHFACHGVQDATNPIDSGLCLADGRRLKISNIVGLSRSRGGLAFLSACQTAKGDEGLSDEAVHIAAGMLFAGYEGVIGSMWSISDRLAPIIARDVYEHLFRNGTRPDHREAALALHEAIGRLRANDEATFNEWVPFIHVGL